MFVRFFLLVSFILATHICVHLLTCAWDRGGSSSLCRRLPRELMFDSHLQLPDGGGWRRSDGAARAVEQASYNTAAAGLSLVAIGRPQDRLQLRRADSDGGGGDGEARQQQVGLGVLDTVATTTTGFRKVVVQAAAAPPPANASAAGHHDGDGFEKLQEKKRNHGFKLVKLQHLIQQPEEQQQLRDGMTYHNLSDFNTRAFHQHPRLCGPATSARLQVRPDWQPLDCPDFWACTNKHPQQHHHHHLAAVCLNSPVGTFSGDRDSTVPAHLLAGAHPARTLLRHGDYFGATLLLSDVYTNYHAQVFDSRRLYIKGGCGEHFPDPLFISTNSTTRVARFDVAVNLAMGLYNYYHALVESVPRWAAALPLLRRMPGATLLVSRNDDVYRYVLQVLGVDSSLAGFNVHYLDGPGDLAWAATMVVPVSQPCGHSSVAAWDHIRRHHLRIAPAAAAGTRTSVYDSVPDWVVVVGGRSTTRRVNETAALVSRLARALGPRRVRLFLHRDAVRPRAREFRRTRALLARAVVYVAPHGAGLSNMVFMPRGSSVVEVRPAAFSNACYENLAAVLGFRYYLFYSPGGKDSTLTVRVDDVVSLVTRIVRARGAKVPHPKQQQQLLQLQNAATATAIANLPPGASNTSLQSGVVNA